VATLDDGLVLEDIVPATTLEFRPRSPGTVVEVSVATSW
jgi:hypothetical protein